MPSYDAQSLRMIPCPECGGRGCPECATRFLEQVRTEQRRLEAQQEAAAEALTVFRELARRDGAGEIAVGPQHKEAIRLVGLTLAYERDRVAAPRPTTEIAGGVERSRFQMLEWEAVGAQGQECRDSAVDGAV